MERGPPNRFEAAERLARRRGPTREYVAPLGLVSRERAGRAWAEGRFKRETFAAQVPTTKEGQLAGQACGGWSTVTRAARNPAWAHVFDQDLEKVDVDGGAIAPGRPVGAIGARPITTALHELERAEAEFALNVMHTGGMWTTPGYARGPTAFRAAGVGAEHGRMTFHTTHRRPPRARRRALAGAATVLSTAVAIGAVAGPVAAVAAPRPPAAAASATWAPAPADRGHLLSVTPLATHDRAALSRLLAGAGLPGDTVRYGVTAYRLTYRTVTPQGTPTTATGLFTLPRGGPHRLAVVSDTHGTLAYRHDAPSAADGWARSAAYLYASGGRAVVSPDYLGLGGGPGTHPYMDTRSAVTASVDMLRAARTAAARLDRPLTGDVLATGFSQGGQVAMALGRALHQGADRHFVLRALAPVSGPYDVSGTEVPALFDGRVQGYSGVFYTAYFLVAQNRLHPLYGSPSEAFRAPYDRVVEGLFDGEHEDEDVLRQLPGSVDELLTDRFTHRMRHPTGALRRAMAQADGTCDWRPDVPVRLYTASGDRDVPIGNSESCRDDLAAHDVRAVLADAGDTDHFGAFLRSAPRVARWFAAPARQRD